VGAFPLASGIFALGRANVLTARISSSSIVWLAVQRGRPLLGGPPPPFTSGEGEGRGGGKRGGPRGWVSAFQRRGLLLWRAREGEFDFGRSAIVFGNNRDCSGVSQQTRGQRNRFRFGGGHAGIPFRFPGIFDYRASWFLRGKKGQIWLTPMQAHSNDADHHEGAAGYSFTLTHIGGKKFAARGVVNPLGATKRAGAGGGEGFRIFFGTARRLDWAAKTAKFPCDPGFFLPMRVFPISLGKKTVNWAREIRPGVFSSGGIAGLCTTGAHGALFFHFGGAGPPKRSQFYYIGNNRRRLVFGLYSRMRVGGPIFCSGGGWGGNAAQPGPGRFSFLLISRQRGWWGRGSLDLGAGLGMQGLQWGCHTFAAFRAVGLVCGFQGDPIPGGTLCRRTPFPGGSRKKRFTGAGEKLDPVISCFTSDRPSAFYPFFFPTGENGAYPRINFPAGCWLAQGGQRQSAGGGGGRGGARWGQLHRTRGGLGLTAGQYRGTTGADGATAGALVHRGRRGGVFAPIHLLLHRHPRRTALSQQTSGKILASPTHRMFYRRAFQPPRRGITGGISTENWAFFAGGMCLPRPGFSKKPNGKFPRNPTGTKHQRPRSPVRPVQKWGGNRYGAGPTVFGSGFSSGSLFVFSMRGPTVRKGDWPPAWSQQPTIFPGEEIFETIFAHKPQGVWRISGRCPKKGDLNRAHNYKRGGLFNAGPNPGFYRGARAFYFDRGNPRLCSGGRPGPLMGFGLR